MECGVAHLVNLSVHRGVRMYDITVLRKDFHDPDDFDQLVKHGWLVEEKAKHDNGAWWAPSDELMKRARSRLCDSINEQVRNAVK